MRYQVLSIDEQLAYKAGAVVTVATVMAVITAALMAVVMYKLFTSKKGTTTVPGGWKFTWN